MTGSTGGDQQSIVLDFESYYDAQSCYRPEHDAGAVHSRDQRFETIGLAAAERQGRPDRVDRRPRRSRFCFRRRTLSAEYAEVVHHNAGCSTPASSRRWRLGRQADVLHVGDGAAATLYWRTASVSLANARRGARAGAKARGDRRGATTRWRRAPAGPGAVRTLRRLRQERRRAVPRRVLQRCSTPRTSELAVIGDALRRAAAVRDRRRPGGRASSISSPLEKQVPADEGDAAGLDRRRMQPRRRGTSSPRAGAILASIRRASCPRPRASWTWALAKTDKRVSRARRT